MIAVFETNVANNTQAMRILYLIKTMSPTATINFDLSDGEKILRIDGSLKSIESITTYLDNLGISCEILA